MGKNLPAVQETRVQSLGQEDPLEVEMATHSSILAWRIPWTEEPGGQRSMGSQRIRHSLATNTYRRNEIMMNRKQQKIENRQIDKNNSH